MLKIPYFIKEVKINLNPKFISKYKSYIYVLKLFKTFKIFKTSFLSKPDSNLILVSNFEFLFKPSILNLKF